VTRAEQFASLPEDRARRWEGFGRWDTTYFPSLLGVQIAELRTDYCRMDLAWRSELTQPAGVVHGGVIATLIDTVVVPAIGSGYDDPVRFATVDMHVQYLAAVANTDMVAEGWVVKRGRSTVFCEAEVTSADRLVARGLLTYAVSPSST